jgi:lysophospholipase L1-like esterase
LYPKYTQAIPTTHKPHIILLMIGTNDINNNVEVSNAPTRLSHLMGVLTDENPSSLLVVAQIVPTRAEATNVKVRAYNAAIPDVVQKASDAGRHVLLVDMYTPFVWNAAFAAAHMNDNLHPKQAGLALMRQVWYEKIRAELS